MPITHLKHGKPESERAEDDAAVRATVESVLADIATRGDAAVRDLSLKFDRYAPPAFRLTPSEIVARLGAAIAAELARPELRARMEAQSIAPVLADTPDAFAETLRWELALFSRLAREARLDVG